MDLSDSGPIPHNWDDQSQVPVVTNSNYIRRPLHPANDQDITVLRQGIAILLMETEKSALSSDHWHTMFILEKHYKTLITHNPSLGSIQSAGPRLLSAVPFYTHVRPITETYC